MKSINPKNVADQLIDFLKSSFERAGFTKAVIALSGGVDSATSCALAVRALGADNIYPVLLPYGALSTQATIDAVGVVEKLGIPSMHVTRIDIKPIVDLVRLQDNVRRGNLMARTRMMILYDQAKKQNALVIGTENKTEYLLGYFTRFGDEASDVEPLRNLYKTQVYILAKFLELPDVVLSRVPTAGLWEGQTDEGELGFSYKDADEILSLHFDEKKSTEEIVAAGFSKETIDKVLTRSASNDFKRHLPILP
jgi:NAD+ synthase